MTSLCTQLINKSKPEWVFPSSYFPQLQGAWSCSVASISNRTTRCSPCRGGGNRRGSVRISPKTVVMMRWITRQVPTARSDPGAEHGSDTELYANPLLDQALTTLPWGSRGSVRGAKHTSHPSCHPCLCFSLSLSLCFWSLQASGYYAWQTRHIGQSSY